jgi:hypothetical protein
MARSTPKTEEQHIDAGTVLLELPVAEAPSADFGLRFNTRLTARQSNALRRVAAGMQAHRGMSVDVAGIVTTAQAWRFVMEMLADSLELPRD